MTGRSMRRPNIQVPSWLVVSAVLALAVTPNLTSCSDPCGDDGPGFDNMVASAERWLRVTAPTTFPHSDGTINVTLEVSRVLAPFKQGPPHMESVAIHSWFVPGVEDALDDANDVFLALHSSGLEREMVSYVVARSAERGYFFVGKCMAEGEALLRDRLGRDYDATIERVIGTTGEDRILSLLRAG